jgi:DNA-binding HxlR family transcriptional regulator
LESARIYRHFCMAARALEAVGERWSLLIVRDLLFGPQRFTDLGRSLADITPARLTQRLRQLEAAGIVLREPPTAGREVWYRLTEAGHDLTPVIDALTRWGIDHAYQPPKADEPLHPAPVMIGTKVFLSGQGSRLSGPVTWVWRFPSQGNFTIRYRNGQWALNRGAETSADVLIETSLTAWTRFLTTLRARRLPRSDMGVAGTPGAVRSFARAFAVQLRSA